MNEQLIGQIAGIGGILYMTGLIIWFLWRTEKDDREINKDWYERHNM